MEDLLAQKMELLMPDGHNTSSFRTSRSFEVLVGFERLLGRVVAEDENPGEAIPDETTVGVPIRHRCLGDSKVPSKMCFKNASTVGIRRNCTV